MSPRAALPGPALALLSGLLLCLTHGWVPWLAPLAPLPLLWALRRGDGGDACRLGLVCGACEAFVLAGMLHAGAPVILALCLFYALGRAGFACLNRLTRRAPAPWAPLGSAAAWTAVERLQSAVPGSLPTLLGDTQHVGPLLPLARLGGTYLIGFVLVWLGASLCAGLAAGRGAGAALRPLALPLGATAALCLLAAHLRPAAAAATLSVAVVQGGLPTWAYARAEADPDWAGLPEATYEALSAAAPAADLTVWPETAVWRTWGEDAAFEARLAAVQAARGGALLAGLPRRGEDLLLYNSAVLLAGGAPPQVADKRRLALRAELQFSAPAAPAAPLPWAAAPLGAVFCLESVVPEAPRALAAAGAALLVVLAEGSRFGDTPVGRLHAQRSILRAVESGRTVVHAGQQGYSTVVDADGRAAPALPPFAAAVGHWAVALPAPGAPPTPFVRLGDWALVPLGAAWLAALGGGRQARVHGRGPVAPPRDVV